MGKSMWIWAFFILLIYKQRADVCRASAVSRGGNHSTSICSSPCLLVLNSSDIIAFDYETSDITSVKSGLSGAVTLDYHFSLGYIFWSDLIEQSIKRFSIDNGNTTTIVVNTGVCAGLAVEWRTSRLYWTDSTFKKISVSDVHGLNQHILITELEEPKDIALDPDSGLMFWTDWGRGVNPKIMGASLNGSQRLSIVTVNLQEPTGINLDIGNRRIFWVNSRTGTVESVSYDGGNRKVLFQQSGLQPSGLALFPTFLFLTVWKAIKQVYQIDAITGKMLHSYSISDEKPMDIVPYDASRQAPAFNPCSENNGGCSHFCVPKTSGYECVCSTGLPLKQDGKTCQEKVKTFILFTDSEARSINMISLDVNYSIAQPLLNHLYDQRPTALGFDPVEDRLYWSDVEKGRIMSAFANGTSVKTLFSCNVLKPYGLAIDHVGRNIYWTDAGTNRIEVGRLDGTKRKLLFKDELEEPRAIVLDEKNGIMVWTAWGTKPHIAKAQMDGSARQTLVTGNLSKPDGIIIDQATNRLYWSDAQRDTIEMSDHNGGHRQVILSSAAKIKPVRLAFYQNALYWTDPNNKRIELYNLVDGKPKTVVRDVQKPTDIHVHDPSVLYSDSHPCDQNNGFCSDFCLLKPEGYQCACPTGIALKSDGKNCENDMSRSANSWMLLTEPDSGEINNVSLSIPGNPCFPLKIKTNISRPVAVSYDPLEGKIYWADSSLKLVARAYPDGSSTDVVAYGNVGNPRGLAIDYTGRSLYWCDFGTNKIEVARLDGSYRTTLINSSIERPMAIILDIAGRKMYWSSWGKFPRIEQANMDGSARKVLVNSTLAYVNSFALDHSGGVLYWCDASLHRIERVDFQGNNRKVLLDLSFDNWNPYGLALSGNILYLSDWKKKAVFKYNMSSSVMKVMVQGMGTLMDLHIYNNKTSYKGSTSCSQLNGGCSHLCLPNQSGHQCFCPDGVFLLPHDLFTCQRVITCGPLVPPVNAIISPPTCQSRSYFGQTCRISCRLPGYIVVGARSRVCGSNGKWTGSNNSRCKDITPPSFSTHCPESINFYVDNKCSSVALVSWDEPEASDNSGNVSVSYPEIRPPTHLSASFNPLTYIATDSSGNCVNCSFHLRVIRRSCPALPRPINGILNLSCGYWFGSEALFSCNSQYQLNGSHRRFCDKDGVWSGFPSSCEREEDNNLTGETSNPLSDIWLVLLVVSSVIPIVIMIYIYVRCGRSAKNRGGPIPFRNPIYEVFSVDPLDIVEFTDEINPPENQVGLNDSSEGDYLPDSFEKKKTFNSSGGELSATNDSDVKICIGKGAIPIGVSQEIFYRVVYDTRELLRDIPVGPDETIISPVIECGPHDIRLLKPLEIIIPHCLYMGKAKKEWITVYRTDPGPIKWEKIPSKSEKKNMSRVWFTVKEDSIHIKTMTFCFWCVYCRGAPRMKRATVFASKPNPRRDLIEFRFYIYSDNKEFSGRVKKQDEKQFPDSWQGIEKPFKMYSKTKKITVKLDPEEGWEFDKTPGEQVYICDDSHGGRSRCINTCTFAVKPVKGREVEEFSCNITFQQEGHDEHAIYVNPGFSLEEKSVEPGKARTHFNSASAAGCSTSSAPEERDRDNLDEQPRTSQGLNKSHSVNFPRQRHEANGGPEVNLPTLKRSKKAKSSTQGEGDRANLDEQSKTRQDSKPLSSLLDNGPLLERVCNRLDTSKPGVGDYHDVCSHYDIDSFQVAAVYEKHNGGPSKALIEHLAASHEQLTVAEFGSVLREVAKRGDIAKILEEYDNQ